MITHLVNMLLLQRAAQLRQQPPGVLAALAAAVAFVAIVCAQCVTHRVTEQIREKSGTRRAGGGGEEKDMTRGERQTNFVLRCIVGFFRPFPSLASGWRPLLDGSSLPRKRTDRKKGTKQREGKTESGSVVLPSCS